MEERNDEATTQILSLKFAKPEMREMLQKENM
jgi:hypothetical protein